MIPFFRNIRKKMADDNKPLKYIRYAIGEIVLVVIGILIALSINNWNEHGKALRLEFVALTELKKNIEADIIKMDSTSEKINQRIKSTKIILKSISNSQKFHDSLSTHFGWALVYDRLPFHTGAYESLKSSGNHLINDDALRFEISNYYDYSIKDMENGFQEIRDDFYNYMLAYLRQEFKYFTYSGPLAIPRDFELLTQNKSFSLSLGIFLDVQIMNEDTLQKTLKASAKLLEQINMRIDKIN